MGKIKRSSGVVSKLAKGGAPKATTLSRGGVFLTIKKRRKSRSPPHVNTRLFKKIYVVQTFYNFFLFVFFFVVELLTTINLLFVPCVSAHIIHFGFGCATGEGKLIFHFS